MSVRASVAYQSLALLAMCAVAPPCAPGSIARQTQTLPDIGAPAGGEAVWIARSMRLNGVPMTLKSFTSSTNADDVLHHYERTLRSRADMKTRRAHEGEWRVLAVMTDDYYATIRARNTPQGTDGLIIVTPPLADMKPKKRTRFPYPDSAAVISLQEYEDEGVEAEHISFVSRRSAAIEARAFAARLSQTGWQVLRNEATRTRDGYVIEAQKGAALAFLNVRRADNAGTTILAVWRKG